MPLHDGLPNDATLVHVYQSTPGPAAASLALNQVIMRGPGPFSEAEHEDIAAQITALYAFMNRLVEGHGVGAAPEVLKGNGERLAKIGYDGLAEILGGEPASLSPC